MKNIFLIFILYLFPFSLFSQKVDVQLLKSGNVAVTNWKILNGQYNTVISGSEYIHVDSVSVILEANKPYILQISVFEVYNPDTILFSLKINNEPVILIGADAGVGEHSFPFFTGIRTPETKITGGTTALISEFPWQVYLKAGNQSCGGTIISGNWILTAAHCTENNSGQTILASEMYVKAGANNPFSTSDGKLYNVSEVIVHEGFNSQTLVNDIALLKLSETINFVNAAPIKLLTTDDVLEGATNPGVMSWVTGWGLTSVSPSTLPSALQKVQLPIVSNSQAATVWESIPSTDIMAGYLNGNKDACKGDSGGPMVVPVFGEFKLAGIVSWGSLNCNTYGAYTRVSGFETWIRTNSGIARAYIPPLPAGEKIICSGTGPGLYSIVKLPSATKYEWNLFPSDAGIITGNTENATVSWNVNYIGPVSVKLRVTIDNIVSDWSKLAVNIVQGTKLLSQPNDTVLCAGQPINLKVGVEGYNMLFNWYLNGRLVQSAAFSQLNISGVSTDDSGDYVCEIIGSCGTVSSRTIKMTVHPLTSILNSTPDSKVLFGDDVLLEVNTEGHDLTYQWQKEGSLLENAISSQIVLGNVNASDIGLYEVTVKGTCGIVTSREIYVFAKEKNFSAETEVNVWPTISSNEFNVALSNDDYYNIHLVNTSGKLIRDLPDCRYQTLINVSTLAKGLYIVTVFNKKFRKSVKIIKV